MPEREQDQEGSGRIGGSQQGRRGQEGEHMRGLHTGENAPNAGFYKSDSGTIVRMEKGNHLPPDPRSRKATQWEYVGEKAPEGYSKAA